MEHCKQNAEYEVRRDGTCTQNKQAEVFPCEFGRPFYGVTFLCYAHAYEAGYKNLKNLNEDRDLAEWAKRWLG